MEGLLHPEHFKDLRAEFKENEVKRGKAKPLEDAVKLLIKAEVEYRFMLQLCFMKPYKKDFMDKGYQIAWLRPSVVNRLSEMESEIRKLRTNAFGKDQQ